MSTADGSPLSFAQEQLWFLDQLRSGAATEYLMPAAFRLRGPVRLDALTVALTRIAERHEILRTRYDTVDGTGVQIVDDPTPVTPAVVDLPDVAESDREATAMAAIAADLRVPIDLHRQAPWRVTLLRFAPDDAVLLIVVHHIAFDGWSWGVLMHELGTHYGDALAGGHSPLPELPVQYADYADWQREWWDSSQSALGGQLDYWRDHLAGLPPLDLPTDRSRPAQWHADGDSVQFAIPHCGVEQLAEHARRCGVTPFMLYLTAFQVMLARYSGQGDVAVGVSLAGRQQVEIEPLIGMFVNTVVIRTDLSGEPSFTDAMARVREVTLDAFGNQDVPFARVVEALSPPRDLSRNPVFQVAFALHNQERRPLRLAGVDTQLLPVPSASSPFDLSLHLVENPDGSYRATLQYPTALFDRSTVERMAANYLRLLTDVVIDPTRLISRMSVVADPERAQLEQWNRTDVEQPAGTLVDLFAAQVRATPEAVAVVTGDGDLSYAELAERVDHLADYLRAGGVTTETPVGVSMRRGAELVTALLAVLTAGGTYVPLPPDHPVDRTHLVLADSGVSLVLTQEALLDRFTDGVRAVPVDRDWPAIAGSVPADRPVLRPDNAAYVIYTSGSTGRPKGVVIPHAGIRNRVLWAVERFGMTAADRMLQKTTTGFDASVWEFLAPLVSGGAVVMAPECAHSDPTVMVQAVAEHGVTVLQLVPSVLRLVVEEPRLAECSALRLVFSAGEPLPATLAARLAGIVDVEVVNTYGPTECSIDSTFHVVTGDETAGTVPIGKPLASTQVHVVDGRDELVPIGVPGELCLAGVGLARGYLGRGALTAERFTPNPYATEPGARWYRTGDIARWRADGTLEFLGRVDHQVKVHGVRVEPGEVEAALRQSPQVSAAVVVPRRSGDGDVELVAYVVPSGDEPLRADALREDLAARLPAPMIPSTVVTLDALPLTANGKVDRAALPAPGAPEAAQPAAGGYVAPRTATEETITQAMAEVLSVERVGVEDDFFSLGGHSLLAIRLVLKLRRAFDIELTVAQLFAERTPGNLAVLVDGATGAGEAAAALGAVRPVPRDGELPLSFGQQRLWFLDQLEPGSAEYLIPMAVRLHGPLDLDAFRAAVDAVAGKHEVLRTRYVPTNGEPSQVIDPPTPVSFTTHDLIGAADADSRGRRLLHEASDRPFDLEREHPLRVTVVRVAPDDHLVAMTLHHIVFDAWSMAIFMRDLDTAYQALAAGHPNPLTAPPVQYADFAAWQREQTTQDELARQLAYWKDRLADLSPVDLPTDRPRPALRDPRGDVVALDLPADVDAQLTELTQREGVTPFMVLLAAFQVLLARYTGRDDVAVGTPVAGRTRQETEDVVGFFINSLVLRNDVRGDQTFTELLDQVRRVTLDAFANQDVPFEHLVDALQPDRDLSRNPLFQVMFDLAHLDRFPTTMGDLAVEPVRSGTPVAKFDLTMTVVKRATGPLRLNLEYATALFDRATVERMAGHYVELLRSVVTAPSARLAEANVLTEAERHSILVDWPDPDGPLLDLLDPAGEHHMCVPELFERQVAQRPDAIAVVSGTERLTYAELNARANQLAHHLRRLGVGPETLVASCLERSTYAVVTLLGVLKAGGVYAPFDPDHPTDRLAFMLEDAGARVIVTLDRFVDRLPSGMAPVVALDADAAAIAANPTANLGTRLQASNLAYVIYTSGSTGRPKGVMIDHRAYTHHCRVIAPRYRIGPEDRVVLLSALTFDVSMDQTMATLLAGATLVVSDAVFWPPNELAHRLAHYGVTVMEITPAYYREVMANDVSMLTAMRSLIVSSDIVTYSDAQRWLATGLPATFLGCYGPTEATVSCVLYPLGDDVATARPEATLPIGRTVAGTHGYVLGPDMRPVPVGVPGELCIGGVRLARGYLGRPDLTAERFIPDPFSTEPGARLYRTGDLVSYRADGVIDFLGRIDTQVKIRGFRIELGEIEATLIEHPAVHAAAVVARDFGPGDKRLVAYLVPEDAGAAPDAVALRAYLRDLLPEYMVPSFWVTMDALPLTASKKVDRKSLPTPDPSQADGGSAYVAPRDPTEEAIAQIWSEVLGVERIGIHDGFFTLGGHSLLATRVLARLRARFDVDLPLRRLFEATTVAELAEAVVEAVEADIAGLSDEEIEELLSGEGAR